MALTWKKLKYDEVSATSRILGRKTAGAGAIEELTLSEIMDFIGSAAEGDILYRGASAWARLGKGSDGQVLTLASGLPSWAAASGGSAPSIYRLTSHFNTTSLSFVTVTGLSCTLLANKKYIINSYITGTATESGDAVNVQTKLSGVSNLDIEHRAYNYFNEASVAFSWLGNKVNTLSSGNSLGVWDLLGLQSLIYIDVGSTNRTFSIEAKSDIEQLVYIYSGSNFIVREVG